MKSKTATENSPSTPSSPYSAQPKQERESPTHDDPSPVSPSQRRPIGNSRGPRPGKYQNGKVCFSTWFPTEFMVRLRRFSSNLGSDPATVIRRELASRISNTRLLPEDVAEIEESDRTKPQILQSKSIN